jgi:hypothetical protein
MLPPDGPGTCRRPPESTVRPDHEAGIRWATPPARPSQQWVPKMYRETTFRIGGLLTIALGVALAYGLYSASAGIEFVDAWLAAGMAVGFGAFFLYVAQEEGRDRREFLRSAEEEGRTPPGRRSP